MLTNPFEKFERKRFLYYSKDLNVISMNHALFTKLNEIDLKKGEEADGRGFGTVLFENKNLIVN